jgi:membrane fusion protein (multidrug efflux system)
MREIYIVANYKETQIGGIKPGQAVEIRVDAYPGLALKGRVESFAPASGAQFALLPPENATGNFTKIVQRIPIRIVLDEPLPRNVVLRPGMSVISKIDTLSAPKQQELPPKLNPDLKPGIVLRSAAPS